MTTVSPRGDGSQNNSPRSHRPPRIRGQRTWLVATVAVLPALLVMGRQLNAQEVPPGSAPTDSAQPPATPDPTPTDQPPPPPTETTPTPSATEPPPPPPPPPPPTTSSTPKTTPTVLPPPSVAPTAPSASSTTRKPVAPEPPPQTDAPDDKPKDEPKKDKEKDDDEDSGILGPFRFGPVIGFGIPNVISFGGTAKFFRTIGAGINFGMIPDIKVSMYGEAELKYREYDIYGRIHPFQNGFFLGAGVGYHSVEGKFTKAFTAADFGVPVSGFESADLTTHGSVKAMILTPQIGWFSHWDFGLALGVDIGAQIPIAPSEITLGSAVTVNPSSLQATVDQQAKSYTTSNEEEVRKTLEKIGKTPIPVLNFRIGWLF